MKYPTYSNNIKSKAEWLDSVPKDWETWKLTHLFKIIGSGTTPKSDNPEYYDGEYAWITTSELRENIINDTVNKLTLLALRDYSTLRFYDIGSVLIAMYGATIGRLGILGIKATVNQACCVFSKPINIDSKYLFYWLIMRRPILISLSSGGGQPNLNQDELKKINIPLPSIPEQHSIVAFLDYKTAQIDNLIEKKEQLLKLLEEKRIALITNALTKGLDPNVKMEPSGSEWLGEIPKHWETWKLTHSFLLIGSGTTPKSDNVEYYNGDFPWVTTSELRENTIYDTSNKITEYALKDYSTLTFYDVGSILIAMYGATIGRLGILGIKATVNQACCVFSKPTNMLPHFLYYWLIMYRPILISLSSGGGQPNLNQNELRKIKIPIPALYEQTKIIEYLEIELTKIKDLEFKISEAIDKLKEYRTSLITSAVTGKIDVRNFSQTQLPLSGGDEGVGKTVL